MFGCAWSVPQKVTEKTSLSKLPQYTSDTTDEMTVINKVNWSFGLKRSMRLNL